MDFENTFVKLPSNEISLVQTLPQTEELILDIVSEKSQSSNSFGRLESLYFPALNRQSSISSTIISQEKFSKLKEKFKITGEIPLKNNSNNYNFEILQVIGKGSRGVIYKAFDKFSKQEFALKFLEFQSFSDKNYLNHSRELLILQILNKAFEQTLDSSNFLRLTDFYIDDSENVSGHLYLVIVMEFCISDLNEILNHRKDFGENFSENELLYILFEMSQALSQLKSLGIAHRDIKLDNILYNSQTGLLKLADFSEGKYFDNNAVDQNSAVFNNTLKGSQAYMSPELLSVYLKLKKQVKLNYDPWKSDVFSLGLCIYVLYMKDRNVLLDRDTIKKQLFEWKTNKNPTDLSTIEGLLIGLLEIDPDNRISLEQIERLKCDKRLSIGKEMFQLRNKDIVELALNQQISNNETFLESVKKMIGTAEIYSRVFQTEKAIEKYNEIIIYLNSFKAFDSSHEDSKIWKQMLYFQAKVYHNLGIIFLNHLQNEPAMFNFKEASECLKELEELIFVSESDSDLNEKYELIIERNSLNMAITFQYTFQYPKALQLLAEIEKKIERKLIRILNENNLSESSEDRKRKLRRIYMNFGEIYDSKGAIFRALKDLRKSEEFHEKAIYISEFLNDQELLQIKSYRRHLAKVLVGLNEYEKAISSLQSQIEFNRKNMIYYNEDTSHCFNLLSNIYSRKSAWKDLTKAEDFIEESLKILRKIYNGKEEHANYGFIYGELGKIHSLKGDYIKAENFLVKSNEINKKYLGNDHFNLIFSQAKLARFYKENKKEEKSLEIYQDIYEKFKRNLNYLEIHQGFFCEILICLGELYIFKGEFEKSYIVLNESLEFLTGKNMNNDKNNDSLEKNLVLLCENLMNNEDFNFRMKIKKIKQYFYKADKLNQKSKNKMNSWRLDKICRFIDNR